MNLTYLQYFIEVAKTGSISKAAENLFIAQPNLSRALKELEGEYNVTLFTRTSKGIVLTSKGEELVAYGKKLLRDVAAIDDNMRDKNLNVQKFMLSGPRATYISYAFMEFSKNIKDKYPAEIYYRESNASRTLKNVLEDNYNLGILRYAEKYDRYYKDLLDSKNLDYELISEFTYSLVVSKDSPLAKLEEPDFSDCKDLIEIAHADPYVPTLPLSKVLDDELSQIIDKRIYVFERASQFNILEANPKTFMCVSPMPKHLLDKYNLVQKKFKGGSKKYVDLLIFRKGYKFSELEKKFVEELLIAKKKYIDKKIEE